MFQELPLADHFFPDIELGKKIRTLRWNEPKTSKGFLKFYGSKNPSLTAIVHVHKVTFGNAEIMAPLYNMTAKELITSMNKHYQNVPHNAEFMLIEHLSPTESTKIEEYNAFKALTSSH